MKFAFRFFLLLLLPLQLSAQILTVAPADFTLDDEITITYNASLGNKGLMGFQGPVYIHTGVVDEAGSSNWRNTQGAWGKADERLLMKRLANDQYQITFRPRQFYGLSAEAAPAALAFTFRNADGSRVGKSADGTDIYLPVNQEKQEVITFQERHYQSHNLQGNELVVTTDQGKIQVQAYADGITRVSLNSKIQQPNDNSYSVVLKPQEVKVQVKNLPGYLLYDSPETDVYIQKSPLQLKFIQNGDTILAEAQGFYASGPTVGARFVSQEKEAFYGTGSRAIPFDRRGKELRIRNEAHYGYTMGAPVLNFTVPFLVSSQGYGVLFDNHYEGTVDIAANDPDIIDWRFKGGPASYYVIASKDYPQLLNRYTTLTGKQPLPPFWSLGYIQSKYGYKDEAETRGIVSRFQKEKVPLDAVVLDLYWFGVEGDMGRLDWDRTKFPNAEAMVKDLKAAGVKTIIITEPYFTRTSDNFQELVKKELLVKNEKGEPYIIEDFWTGAAGLIDITKPEAQEWMWQFYKKHIETGIAGWWSDLGEPENHPSGMRHQGGLKPYEVHNIYSHLWAKMLYEGYKKEFSDQRPFNLIRSGYAGSQRYAIFPWSGDIARSWAGFQAQIPIMLGMSMSGIGYMHSDLGGFTGGEKNPELYARWLQMGAFVPIMRAHGAGEIPPEPVFYDEPVKSIVRDYIKLRHRLLPYLYTMSWRNTTEGMPLVLPMNFFDPRNPRFQDINDQYFWGENMLVAPVLDPGANSRLVVLPSGSWIDYWTGLAYAGLQNIRVGTPLERMPLFIKGGSFIPMINVGNNLSEYRTDTLHLQYYAEGAPASSNYTLYLDNGNSTNAKTHELLKLTAVNMASLLSLTVSKEGPGYAEAPKERLLEWEVIGINKTPTAVKWKGKPVTLVNERSQLSPGTGWYDLVNKRLHVHVPYQAGSESLQIEGLSTKMPLTGVSETEGLEGTAVAVGNTEEKEISLVAGLPHPRTGAIDIVFVVPQYGNYTLEVRDTKGRTVFLKQYENISPGRYSQGFRGPTSRENKLAAGTYTLVLTGRDSQKTTELKLKK